MTTKDNIIKTAKMLDLEWCIVHDDSKLIARGKSRNNKYKMIFGKSHNEVISSNNKNKKGHRLIKIILSKDKQYWVYGNIESFKKDTGLTGDFKSIEQEDALPWLRRC